MVCKKFKWVELLGDIDLQYLSNIKFSNNNNNNNNQVIDESDDVIFNKYTETYEIQTVVLVNFMADTIISHLNLIILTI